MRPAHTLEGCITSTDILYRLREAMVANLLDLPEHPTAADRIAKGMAKNRYFETLGDVLRYIHNLPAERPKNPFKLDDADIRTQFDQMIVDLGDAISDRNKLVSKDMAGIEVAAEERNQIEQRYNAAFETLRGAYFSRQVEYLLDDPTIDRVARVQMAMGNLLKAAWAKALKDSPDRETALSFINRVETEVERLAADLEDVEEVPTDEPSEESAPT